MLAVGWFVGCQRVMLTKLRKEVFIGAFEWFHNNVRVFLEAMSGLTFRKVNRVTMQRCFYWIFYVPFTIHYFFAIIVRHHAK